MARSSGRSSRDEVEDGEPGMDTGAEAKEEATEPERRRMLPPPVGVKPLDEVRVLISAVEAEGRRRMEGGGLALSMVELFVREPGAE